jgi:stringent starvation protein B
MASEKISQMKRLMAEALLEEQGRCFLHIIPSQADGPIQVPPEHLERDSCTLALNLRTQDPQIDDWGVVLATSFGSRPFTCEVPWSAVVQVFDPEQKAAVLTWLFPLEGGEAESEAAEETSGSGEHPSGEEAEGDKDKRRSHLKVIK